MPTQFKVSWRISLDNSTCTEDRLHYCREIAAADLRKIVVGLLQNCTRYNNKSFCVWHKCPSTYVPYEHVGAILTYEYVLFHQMKQIESDIKLQCTVSMENIAGALNNDNIKNIMRLVQKYYPGVKIKYHTHAHSNGFIDDITYSGAVLSGNTFSVFSAYYWFALLLRVIYNYPHMGSKRYTTLATFLRGVPEESYIFAARNNTRALYLNASALLANGDEADPAYMIAYGRYIIDSAKPAYVLPYIKNYAVYAPLLERVRI